MCFFFKVVYKLFSKLPCICLPLKKLVNRKYFLISEKYFLVKEKFGLIFIKIFFFYFERKILFESCEKFRNVILFLIITNLILKLLIHIYIYIYIYIYIFFFFFVFFFFNFIPYNLFFITLVLIFIIFICFSLIIF